MASTQIGRKTERTRRTFSWYKYKNRKATKILEEILVTKLELPDMLWTSKRIGELPRSLQRASLKLLPAMFLDSAISSLTSFEHPQIYITTWTRLMQ